ncbi:MAG: Hpt domain-containing protein, partial [Methylovulum sp.]|nr:Hpt domain-containing protein [Methylovulum sp.]
MIDDPDLRLMFKAECEERLHNLEQHLLQLEKQPELADAMNTVFREAHSLKGLARMLNVKDMEQVAHHFESVLKAALHNNCVLDSGDIERLYHGVDDLRGLARVAITGMGYGKTLDTILAGLAGRDGTAKPSPIPAATQLAAHLDPDADAEALAEALEAPMPQATKIDTIRVGTQQLDNLMTHVSELTVNKNRLAQRLSDINELMSLWDEWKQQTRPPNSPALMNLENRLQGLRGQLYEDNNRFDYLNNEIGFGIRSIRLLPFSTTFNLFPRMVRDIAKQQHKHINLLIEGDDTVADKRVIEETKDPLTHLLRTPIDHAIESPELRRLQGKPEAGTIRLSAQQTPTTIIITVKDDGTGLDIEKIKHR